MTGLTVITPTGGRPQAFELCQRFVERQTWNGWLQWIIVNDVDEINVSTQRANTIITPVYPKHKWMGWNSLRTNLEAALPAIMYDQILFVEDDDWYSATYFEEMAKLLEVFHIVGNAKTRYYHIPSRLYRIMEGEHASLCQTGITRELLPLLQGVLRAASDFIDYRLWNAARGHRRCVDAPLNVVGLKGLPGRAGIGVGHRPHEYIHFWSADNDGSVLRSWIGEDTKLYEEFQHAA